MSDTEDPNKRTAKPKKAIKARRLIAPKDAPKQKHTTQAERDKTPALSQRGGKGVKRMDLSKVEKEFLQESSSTTKAGTLVVMCCTSSCKPTTRRIARPRSYA